MTRASSSSASAALSGVLAAVITKAIGTPPPSVRTWRLVPALARSVGFGPVFFPTQRGFVQGRIRRLPRPLQALGRIIVLEEQPPHRLPHAVVDPALESPMHCRSRAELPRDGLPLATRPQHVEHRVQNPPRGNPRPAARALQLLAREHVLHDEPQVVRNLPDRRDRSPSYPHRHRHPSTSPHPAAREGRVL